MIGYDYTHSGIDGNGNEYITFLLAPERLDKHGLRCGPAIHIGIDNKHSRTDVYKFHWISGAPRQFEHILTLKGETIADSEVPAIMDKVGISISPGWDEEDCFEWRGKEVCECRKP